MRIETFPRLCGNPLPPGSSEVFDSVVHLSIHNTNIPGSPKPFSRSSTSDAWYCASRFAGRRILFAATSALRGWWLHMQSRSHKSSAKKNARSVLCRKLKAVSSQLTVQIEVALSCSAKHSCRYPPRRGWQFQRRMLRAERRFEYASLRLQRLANCRCRIESNAARFPPLPAVCTLFTEPRALTILTYNE